MRKTTRSLLITSLVLVALGLIITLSSVLAVTILQIDPYNVEVSDRKIETKDLSLNDILSQSPNSHYMKQITSIPFQKVDLHSYAGDITILPTEGESFVSLQHANTANLSVEIVGDTLTIREINPVGFMGLYIDDDGFSFKGLRQIFGPGNSANSGKTITLYLSRDAVIDSISVTSKIGNVHMNEISAGSIDVDSFSGNVTISNLYNKETKIRITGSFTSLDLINSCYESCNASIRLGSIDASLCDCVNNSTVLDVWVGKVMISAPLSADHYKLSLTTSIGTVRKNDVDVGGDLSSATGTSTRISSTVMIGPVNFFSNEVA